MNVCRLMCLSGVLLVLAGCKKADGKRALVPGEMPPSAVVVSVDGVTLTFGEMDRHASGLHTNALLDGVYYATNMLNEAVMSFRRKAINEFVYKTVMLNEAARLDVTVSKQEEAAGLQRLSQVLLQSRSSTNDYFNKGPLPPDMMRRGFHESLVIGKLFDQVVQRNVKVMDQDVEKMADDLGMTNALRRVVLEAARKQIMDGAPFEDVARAISQDGGTARHGGALEEFARGDKSSYKGEFEDTAFSLAPGEVSEIVETAAGYHIIKVTSRTPARAATDDAPAVAETVRASHILIRKQPIDRQKIATAVYMTKFAEGRQALFEELKAKAKIENVLFPDMQYRAASGTR